MAVEKIAPSYIINVRELEEESRLHTNIWVPEDWIKIQSKISFDDLLMYLRIVSFQLITKKRITHINIHKDLK